MFRTISNVKQKVNFVFVISALIAASKGDFSGVGIIGKVVVFFVLWFGIMYTVAACMGAFD